MLAPVDRIEGTARLAALALALLSLSLRDPAMTAGVVLGSLVALGSYRALAGFVRALVAAGGGPPPRLGIVLHVAKYAVIAAVIAVALKFRIANPVALLVGASVILPGVARESLAPARAANAKEA